ncbi:hypothetical protein HF650_16810 [Kosakonia sp. SMBL-WEM22]|uniref:hypothetical protein n=1 Tax=Kosakonia sp. SMBL-WEM22 TaxID=2725560 RepID=UPI0016593E4E|nr:hypothetical protein [Kosakonia sp. SMBL-WEM22]QNQ21276.1 hypothetical protein HF650_16810 [Kosakonia sp. SMBL-WEM22]
MSEGELNIFSILKKLLTIDTAEGFMTIKNKKRNGETNFLANKKLKKWQGTSSPADYNPTTAPEPCALYNPSVTEKA